ncbi:hypothetical protein EDB19DRAFT_932084 [Suillus lakei]|nr:hypothetical protein EDB19DRAFT_932084 [Suillus lakei]
MTLPGGFFLRFSLIPPTLCQHFLSILAMASYPSVSSVPHSHFSVASRDRRTVRDIPISVSSRNISPRQGQFPHIHHLQIYSEHLLHTCSGV